jgi:hypothetical protein
VLLLEMASVSRTPKPKLRGARGLSIVQRLWGKKVAEEEKAHALRFIKFVVDTGARVNILAVPAPQAQFKVAEDAVKLSLEQEEKVTTQINALLSMAKAESDYTAEDGRLAPSKEERPVQ